jgi:excisionase family DNA binding protein
MNDIPPILSRGQIAELFGVSGKTVTRWVLRGEIPRPMQIGGTQRWRLESLVEHLRQKELAAAGEPVGPGACVD